MKALVVGGSSGVGLSITLELASRPEFDTVWVLDKNLFPEQYQHEKINHCLFDLISGDYSLLSEYDDADALFITAGFGKLEYFQNLSDKYLDDIFAVNSIAPIRIIRHFYPKMLSNLDFYAAVMVSIAGRLCSPLFSEYSATKAALRMFIEAINVELEVQGSKNRVLEVSPGSLKGTSFSGGVSDPKMTKDIAAAIISMAEKRDTLYIPQYDEVYANVLERYRLNPHQFGVDSYQYKMCRIAENETK